MNMLEILLISISLAMDAFAVSICKGITNNKNKYAIITGLYFGLFQALMPLFGYFLGSYITNYVEAIDHYIIFIFLAIIGINMEKDAFSKKEINSYFDYKTMIILSIATSIDSFTMGITFSLLKINILMAVSYIGIITFALSFIGFKIGNIVGEKISNYAEFIAGIILFTIGLKIFFEHIF